MNLFIESLLVLLAFYLVGIAIGWLLWGRRGRA
jgi:hypothetical protein